MCPCGDTVTLRHYMTDWYDQLHWRVLAEEDEYHIGRDGHLEQAIFVPEPPDPRSR